MGAALSSLARVVTPVDSMMLLSLLCFALSLRLDNVTRPRPHYTCVVKSYIFEPTGMEKYFL